MVDKDNERKMEIGDRLEMFASNVIETEIDNNPNIIDPNAFFEAYEANFHKFIQEYYRD